MNIPTQSMTIVWICFGDLRWWKGEDEEEEVGVKCLLLEGCMITILTYQARGGHVRNQFLDGLGEMRKSPRGDV